MERQRIHSMKMIGKDKLFLLLNCLKRYRLALNEAFWGSCAFILFLLAGPFSTPVVLLALANLAKEAQQADYPEPQSLR
jgi:hypothetical protein